MNRMYDPDKDTNSISNNSEVKDTGMRKRTRVFVEQLDLDSENLFPHVPLTTGIHAPREDNPDEPDVPDDSLCDSIAGDRTSIALLIFLYVLQGIPLGLAGSIPMILQSRNITYKQQALFSLVYWPFSVKLLWAPIVDALYLHKIGRRKSWMVPTQYLIGVFMILLSYHIPFLLGETPESGGQVSIVTVTMGFFVLNFLAATQDIAVDGWALTMLSRRNIGWASTCNSVGQTAGYFLGNVLFLALESADFCNTYLRSSPHPHGIVTLPSFLMFWGVVFIVTTTVVFLYKRELRDPEVDPEQGIIDTYRQLFSVVKLPAVRSYALILLTSRLGFAAADSLTSLKIIEAGMPKQRLAMFVVPMVPLQMVLPIILSKYTSGPRPMSVFIKAYPFRLCLGLLYMVGVWLAFHVQTSPGEFPFYYYAFMLSVYALHQVFVMAMFVSLMAFNAKVSDPVIGGSYMTLLNTLSNLGGTWTGTFALWIVEALTQKTCIGGSISHCNTPETLKVCQTTGKCEITVDGYYIESVICMCIGFLWLLWRRRRLQHLDSLDLSAWKYRSTT